VLCFVSGNLVADIAVNILAVLIFMTAYKSGLVIALINLKTVA